MAFNSGLLIISKEVLIMEDINREKQFEQITNTAIFEKLVTGDGYPKPIMIAMNDPKTYGANIESEKISLIIVGCSTMSQMVGLKPDYEIVETHDKDVNIVIHSFKSVMDGLSKGEPWALEVLSIREEDIVWQSTEWSKVVSRKELFCTRRAVINLLRSGDKLMNEDINIQLNYAGADEIAFNKAYEAVSELDYANISARLIRRKPIDLDIPESNCWYIDGGFNSGNTSVKELIDFSNKLRNIILPQIRAEENRRVKIKIAKAKIIAKAFRYYRMAYDIINCTELNAYSTSDTEILTTIMKGDCFNELDDNAIIPSVSVTMSKLRSTAYDNLDSRTVHDNADEDDVCKIIMDIVRS